jgi:hypothetical protein
MADAKEVGVGDPAEENTFCHRTISVMRQQLVGDKLFLGESLPKRCENPLATPFYWQFE